MVGTDRITTELLVTDVTITSQKADIDIKKKLRLVKEHFFSLKETFGLWEMACDNHRTILVIETSPAKRNVILESIAA